jgi:hypothetical protein
MRRTGCNCYNNNNNNINNNINNFSFSKRYTRPLPPNRFRRLLDSKSAHSAYITQNNILQYMNISIYCILYYTYVCIYTRYTCRAYRVYIYVTNELHSYTILCVLLYSSSIYNKASACPPDLFSSHHLLRYTTHMHL